MLDIHLHLPLYYLDEKDKRPVGACFMRKTQSWVTEGFEIFSKGIFGNTGQNLYVSLAGVFQCIHQYDLNKNGYFDLVFCNDHDHGENTPTYVYQDVLGIPTRYPYEVI